MKMITIGKVRELPDLVPHPESMLRALRGLCVPFNLDQVYRYLARFPDVPKPTTACAPVLLMDIVAALGDRGRIEALIYWRDVIRPHYLAIPVASCTLNEQ